MNTYYHGTSLEAALAIQANGFRVDLSGSNAGAMLGTGNRFDPTLSLPIIELDCQI